MDIPEVKTFLAWYEMEREKGLLLPIHYSTGASGGFYVTDATISLLQLIVLGMAIVSDARALTLESIFRLINNDNAVICGVACGTIKSLAFPEPTEMPHPLILKLLRGE